MNRGPFIFLGVFTCLAVSWGVFVLLPQFTLGNLAVVEVKELAEQYPIARPGMAAQGAQIYRANGCYTCHSEQVRPSGSVIDVVLISPGTNQAPVVEGLRRIRPTLSDTAASAMLKGLPKAVAAGLDMPTAENYAALLSVGGAEARVRLTVLGADIERGWGKRRSVAQDYIHDYPVMAGSQRIGPDLANIGERQPDPVWHLRHLYNPNLTTPEGTKSVMPPYPYLFEKRKIGRQPSADALELPDPFAVEPGYEVVPRDEAKALVAYLLSLKANASLFETPLPKAATNAPAAPSTNAPPTAASTNAPAR